MTHAVSPLRPLRAARFIGAAALIGIGLGLGAPAAAQQDTVVATVNGEQITRADLQAMQAHMAQQIPQLGMLPLEAVYEGLLERAIDQKLLTGAGEAANLGDSPEVQQQLEQIRSELVQRAFLQQAIEERLTEERLREAYQSMVADQPAEEEINARHILVESEEKAREIIAELKKNGDFAALAAEHSRDRNGAEGGDLGWFTADVMVPEFAEAAFALDPGKITEEPVRTQFGWHVIKVEERRTAEPPTFEEAREDLRNALAEEVVSDVLESLRADATVQTFGLDGKPSQN